MFILAHILVYRSLPSLSTLLPPFIFLRFLPRFTSEHVQWLLHDPPSSDSQLDAGVLRTSSLTLVLAQFFLTPPVYCLHTTAHVSHWVFKIYMVHGVTITADVMTLVSSVSIYFEVNVKHTLSFFVPLGPILRGRGSLLGALFPMS